VIFTESKKLFHWRRVKRNKREYQVCKQVLVYTAFGFGASAVQAGPTGGEITSGSGTITQNGNITDIVQATKRLDINWETFSTLPDETVNFLQPNSMAVAINRVIGGVPSSLAGTLNANGRVFILNEAGIVFHQSSVVNVAGLLATTATNVDVDGDKWNFRGTGYGSVLNHGQINISDGGFAVLAAPYIQNTGGITANLGQIQLASTNTYTMDLRGDGLITFSIPEEAVQQIQADGEKLGVDNSGTLQARSGVVGITAKTASDLITGAVNLTGVIDATSFDTGHDGGSVQLVSAGDINIKSGAQILADGGVNGDGGEIVTWADGTTRFEKGAKLSARGGDEAGDGGFIELSGNTVAVRSTDVDTRAPQGLMGIFMIDPDVIIIANGAGTDVTAGSAGVSTLYEQNIEAFTTTNHLILQANDLITMRDLADNTLNVSVGGITLRVINDADGVARIEFQDLNDSIRSTVGNITIEVLGNNNSATGVAEVDPIGDEIQIGNIFVQALDANTVNGGAGVGFVIDAGDVFINATDGSIVTGEINILGSGVSAVGSVLNRVFTDLTITASEDITLNGPVSVRSVLNHASGNPGILASADTASADVLISAGSNLTAISGVQVSALMDIVSGNVAIPSRVIADLEMDAGIGMTITGAVSVEAEILNQGNLGSIGRTIVDASLVAGQNITFVDDGILVRSNILNAGANPGANVASADLLISAGTAGTGSLDVAGDIELIAKATVPAATARNETFATAVLNAADNIIVGGSNGVIVNATGTNSGEGLRVVASADLSMTAFSGSIDITNGDVEVTAKTRYVDTVKTFVDADAHAKLIANNGIFINGDITVAATNFVNVVVGNGPGIGGPDGQADADATLSIFAGIGTSASIDVGGLTTVLASNDKTGGSGSVAAFASANFDARLNINLGGGISVNAINDVNNTIRFLGADATANLFVDAGTGVSTGALTIGSAGVEVIASNNVAGTATANADVIANANASLNAWDGITISDSTALRGVVVRAISNSTITGPGPDNFFALADANLDIDAGAGSSSGDLVIYGDVIASASASKVDGSGGAQAYAVADLSAHNNILVNDGGITVNAIADDPNATSADSVNAIASLFVDAGNGGTSGGISIDNNVDVTAQAIRGGLSGVGGVSAYGFAGFEAFNNISVGDITIDVLASNDASGAVNDVLANAILNVNAGIGSDATGGGAFSAGAIAVTATANMQEATTGNATATADVDIDAFQGISIGGLQASAEALIGSGVTGTNTFAYGRAWADLEAGSNVVITGSVDVSALASNLASAINNGSNDDAFAIANLDIDAATGGTATAGSVSIDGNLSVNATAILGSNITGTQNSAIALAFADVISRNAGISITGDVTVAALAQSDASKGNQITAFADLYMNAASAAVGPVDYDLVIGGDLSVTATASNNSASSINMATANAFAGAYLIAANDIAISSTGTGATAVNVSANATLNSANSNTGNGYGAYAEARLTVRAGNNGSSGSFTMTGDMLIGATATMTGTAGSDRTAEAYGWGYLAAFDSITIDGNLSVITDANQDATGSNLRANAFSLFYGVAGTGLPSAAGDFTLTGNFLASAEASITNGTNFGGDARADDDVYISAFRDIDIGGNFTVNAEASFASDMTTAYGFDAEADADATLLAGRNITIDGSLAITADAQSLAGASSAYFGGYASADAELFVYAGALGSGNIDIGSVTPGLTISANANLPHAYGDADATAQAYMIAANNIDITGDVSVTAVAVATATSTKDVDVSASAFIDMYAGVGSAGTGSITINSGNMLVSADADLIGGYGQAEAYAGAYMSAYNDITIDGNLSLIADAFGSDQHDDERNGALASFFARAGLASAADLNTANGFGDFTVNGDVLVSASAEQLNFSAGTWLYANGQFAPYAEASISVSANRDINISGSVDVLADATFTQPSTVSGVAYGIYGAAYVEAEASLDFEAGRNVTIGGDVNAIANALNAVEVDLAYAGAQAVADIDIDAGLGFVSSTGSASTGFVDIGGNILANADARFTGDAQYGGFVLPLTPYGGTANAYASVDVQSRRDDITVDGDVDVIAFADNQGNSSSYALASAYLRMDAAGTAAAGTADSFDLTIGGDVNVVASAHNSAAIRGNDADAFANAYLLAANNININSAGTASNAINVTAFASNQGAYIAGDASADARLNVDAGNGGSSGSITVTGNVNVTAEARYTGSITESADADVDAVFVAFDDITITGDITVTALANSVITASATSGSEGDASASANLVMNAGTGSAGSLLVTGNILVSADADASNATDDAFAYAAAVLSAANDVTVSGTGGIQVLADALITNGQGPSGAEAYAILNIQAGTHSASGSIDITGPVTVTANAVQNGTSATQGVVASADVYMSAWNSITIGDDVLVSANATNNATGVGGTNALNADADAILTLNAGTGGTSGSITISGNVNNTAVADLNDDSASTTISANANAKTTMTAFNDISITGFLNVLGSASVASGLGGTPATVNAVGLATADIDAGGNVDIGSFVAINANAVNSGTATMNNLATATAQFLVNAGTQGSGNITIGTSLAHTVDVMANAFLSSNASGSVANSVSALANMNMAAASGSVVVAGDVTVTASADNNAQTGDAATASALLVIDAGVAGTGDLDINLQGDVLVQSVADIANNATANANLAKALSSVDLDAAGDIIISDVSSDATAVQVIATANNNGAFGNGATASAMALVNMNAGDDGVGSLTINAESNNALLVTADANKTGTATTASAVAVADVDLIAATDITLDGNVAINANADNLAVATFNNADADATFTVNAGQDFVMTSHDIDVTVTVPLNTGIGTAAAFGSIDIDAGRDILLTNVNTDLFVTGSAGAGATSADVMATANQNFDAGRHITHTGTVNVVATAINSAIDGSFARANATLNMDAGSTASGDLTFDGTMRVVGQAHLVDGGPTSDVTGNATVNLFAADSVNLTVGTNGTAGFNGIVVAGLANSFIFNSPSASPTIANGVASTANANATLNVDAGNGSNAGYGNITLTGDVAAVALANGTAGTGFGAVNDHAVAAANVNFLAYNDISIDGAINVSAAVQANPALVSGDADAHFLASAGTGGTGVGGSIQLGSGSNDSVIVNAFVSLAGVASGSANADADVTLNAWNNITVDSDIDVSATAFAAGTSSPDVIADAAFIANAGLSSDSGSFTNLSHDLSVTAYADNNAGPFTQANANATIVAYDNVIFGDSASSSIANIFVRAEAYGDADGATSGSVIANAGLSVTADTGFISVHNDFTRVSADAYASSATNLLASANATATFTAQEDISFTGGLINVFANGYGDSADILNVVGNATLTMLSTSGSVNLANSSTYVTAIAEANADYGTSAVASANAIADITGFDGVTVSGNILSVSANADADNADTASALANANLNILSSSGSVSLSNNFTLVNADAETDYAGIELASANAIADINGFFGVDVSGDTLSVSAYADAYGAYGLSAATDITAIANADLTILSSSGSVNLSNSTTIVYAAADAEYADNAVASANATADINGLYGVTVSGDYLQVTADAETDAYLYGALASANANADLSILSSSGSVELSNGYTVVHGDANADANYGTSAIASANAIADINGLYGVTVSGYSMTVSADADADNADVASALANADLGILSSSGSITMSNVITAVYASADVDYGHVALASANAAADFNGLYGVSVSGYALEVAAYAFADAYGTSTGASIDAIANADLTILSSSGSVYLSNSDTVVYAAAAAEYADSAVASANATADINGLYGVAITGDDLVVAAYADAYGASGAVNASAVANADLSILSSSGSVYMSNGFTSVNADAYADAQYGTNAVASANAAADINGLYGVTISGDTLEVEAFADAEYADLASAVANADLSILSSSGSVTMSNGYTEVDASAQADYAGSAMASANAAADINGLYGVTISGYSMEVVADAEADAMFGGVIASANANADLSILSSSGSVELSNGYTLVHGDAEADAQYGSTAFASANAVADINGFDGVVISGERLEVSADADADDADLASAIANADLGILSSSGSVTMSNGYTEVEASADTFYAGSGLASANAVADINGFDGVDVSGDYLTVSAYADFYGTPSATIGSAIANADLNILSSSGSVTMSNGYTQVYASAEVDYAGMAMASANAMADINGNLGVDVSGDTLSVVAAADAYGMPAGTNASAIANADLTVLSSSGSATLSNSNTLVAAIAFASMAGTANATANATGTLTGNSGVNVTGNSLQVAGFAGSLFGSSVGGDANATLNITATSGDIFLDNSVTAVDALSYAGFASFAAANADAMANLNAGNNVLVTNSLNIDALASNGIASDSSASANATLSMIAGSSIDVASVNVDAYANAFSGPTAVAVANATGTFSAGSDITFGNISITAEGDAQGTASASANGTLTAGLNINGGDINVSASADNFVNGTGDAIVVANMTMTAGSSVDIDGITVNADALCSGATGSCNPNATATGNVTAPGDISISGPINVSAIAIANNTGSAATASASFVANAGGNLNVGPINTLAFARINHSGAAVADATGTTVLTAGSNMTVSDVITSANAINLGSTGSANGVATSTITTGTGDITINGSLISVATLIAPDATSGTAGITLIAAGGAGQNIAGNNFSIPLAVAGPASVQSLSSTSTTVGAATAFLVISPTIVVDNSLTLRSLLTNLEPTGFLLHTWFGTYPGGGSNGDGTNGSNSGFRNGTPRGIVFNLPDGAGPGGFAVDDNGNVIFRPSFGGLPQNAALPLPFDICDSGGGKRGSVVNCGWEDEPVFY
jgi:filamentous hemagglutinin family protein